MIAALLLAALQPAAHGPPPVEGWDSLPVFPLPRVANVTEEAEFVRREVEAGRCAAALHDGATMRLSAPVAIRVDGSGVVRQIVPQAIGCPTVEQYTVGFLQALTRGGPGSSAPLRAGWYNLTVGYSW
jgi:hypothetical protein